MGIGIVLCMTQAAFAAAEPAAPANPDVAGLVRALGSPREPTRLEAIDELGELGPKAAPAIGALANELIADASASVRARAAKALGRIGRPALESVGALIRSLQDSDAVVRWAAVESIAQLRPDPDAVLLPLVRMLKDPEPSVRLRAVGAIASFGEDAIGPLVPALRDSDTVYWACLAIERLGPEAKRSVPVLAKLVDDGSAGVRQQAILALAAIGPASAPAAGQIARALDDPPVRVAATYALASIGSVSSGAEAKIRVNATSRDDPLTRIVSLWALVKLHPRDEPLLQQATTAFVDGLRNQQEPVRAAAARSLGEIRPGPAILAPLLVKMLKNADPQTARQAMDALAAAGPALAPTLIQCLDSPSIRAEVAYALGRTAPGAEASVGALAGLLSDPDPNVRREAALALANFGPKSRPAVPALIEILKSSGNNPEYGPIYALGRIGPAAITTKPLLVRYLSSSDETLTLLSAWALACIDPSDVQMAERAVPLLLSGLSYPEPGVRQQAAFALGRLGPLARTAIPMLTHTTSDGNPLVREAAGEALQAINRYQAAKPPRALRR